jgi:hypothetical protein
LNLGTAHLDTSDLELSDEGSGDENLKRKALAKPQWRIQQEEVNTLDASPFPCDYICLPKKLFGLFKKFKCRNCHATKREFTIEQFALAQSLFYSCGNCDTRECVRADLTTELERKWSVKPTHKKFLDTNQYNRSSAADFQINMNLYLGAHQCGGGRNDARVIAGMLGVHHNALRNTWKSILRRNLVY